MRCTHTVRVLRFCVADHDRRRLGVLRQRLPWRVQRDTAGDCSGGRGDVTCAQECLRRGVRDSAIISVVSLLFVWSGRRHAITLALWCVCGRIITLLCSIAFFAAAVFAAKAAGVRRIAVVTLLLLSYFFTGLGLALVVGSILSATTTAFYSAAAKVRRLHTVRSSGVTRVLCTALCARASAYSVWCAREVLVSTGCGCDS